MAPVLKSAFLLLVLLVLPVGAQVETEYFEIGGTLVLVPKVSDPITGFTWKHKGNIVAEWMKDRIPLEYLGDFKGRSEVDLTTGILTIRGIQKAEEGEFRVEINSRELPGKFNAVGLRNLKGVPVEVAVKPLACSAASKNCTLDCSGDFADADAGPVRFFWKKGATGPWVETKESNITIFNNEETKKIESFSCKAKNPLGETKESKAEKNPLTQEASGGGSGWAVGVGVIFGLLVVAGVGFGGYKYYNHKQKQGGNERQFEMDSGDNNHPGGQNEGQTGPGSPERNYESDHHYDTGGGDSLVVGPKFSYESDHYYDTAGEGDSLVVPNAAGNSENGPKVNYEFDHLYTSSGDYEEPSKPNVSTVYSAVRSFNPGEADQSEVPNVKENSEKEPDYENGPTPNNDS